MYPYRVKAQLLHCNHTSFPLPSQDDCYKYCIFSLLWINYFPVKNVVSTKHLPRAIVVHTKLIWKKHCKVDFGNYREVQNESVPSN